MFFCFCFFVLFCFVFRFFIFQFTSADLLNFPKKVVSWVFLNLTRITLTVWNCVSCQSYALVIPFGKLVVPFRDDNGTITIKDSPHPIMGRFLYQIHIHVLYIPDYVSWLDSVLQHSGLLGIYKFDKQFLNCMQNLILALHEVGYWYFFRPFQGGWQRCDPKILGQLLMVLIFHTITSNIWLDCFLRFFLRWALSLFWNNLHHAKIIIPHLCIRIYFEISWPI